MVFFIEINLEEMMMFNKMLEKINDKTAILGVIGLGYVGLPLAVEKAKAGYRVIGIDIQPQKAELVNKGKNYIGDVLDNDLSEVVKSGMLTASADFSKINECDCVAICVPTPLDEYYQPDISYVEASTKECVKYSHEGMLVILESTTYPGTTEEIIKPLFEEKGYIVGENIFIAFSPERVDPGNRFYNTKNTPKVVGGVSKSCTELAAKLYENVLSSSVFRASSPKVAEMEKILENTFRNINIALANEMAILCERMNIPVWEVVEAASTKPYGFMPFYPSAGVGGHCIPIDPFYLTWKARGFDYHTRLIELAGEINNSMPEYVVERISKLLNNHEKSIKGSKIFVLGVAYKADIDDIRQSPALKVLELLDKKGAKLRVNDPHIKSFKLLDREWETEQLNEDILSWADLVVVLTGHSFYNAEYITEHSKLIFDTRNITKGIEKEIIERL